MKPNNLITSITLLLTLLLSSTYSTTSLASDNTESSKNKALNGLKVAIIKDAIGTSELVSGLYNQGLEKLKTSTSQMEAGFEQATGLCVANLKTKRLSEADKACNQAIHYINHVDSSINHIQFLKSLAYSNRGIVRYLSNDNLGALDDFITALLIDNNHIVQDNLINIKTIVFRPNNTTITLAKTH